MKRIAESIAEVTGKEVKTLGITKESFYNEPEKYSTPNEEMYLSYKAFAENECPRDVQKSKEVYPDQWDVKAWAQKSQGLRAFVA